MSTHEIGFYEEINKIISELSSNNHQIHTFCSQKHGPIQNCSYVLYIFRCLKIRKHVRLKPLLYFEHL